MMTKRDIEYQILELKSDYVRIQSDLEKLDSVGGNTANAEKQLASMEVKLAELNRQLEEAE